MFLKVKLGLKLLHLKMGVLTRLSFGTKEWGILVSKDYWSFLKGITSVGLCDRCIVIKQKKIKIHHRLHTTKSILEYVHSGFGDLYLLSLCEGTCIFSP